MVLYTPPFLGWLLCKHTFINQNNCYHKIEEVYKKDNLKIVGGTRKGEVLCLNVFPGKQGYVLF